MDTVPSLNTSLLGGIVFIYGLSFGSFANVLALRTLKSETILSRSKCPACAHTLNWVDLIPVAGYLHLRGRCRYCGARISPMYPLVELISGVLWLAFFLQHGLGPEFLLYASFSFFLIVNAITDLLKFWVFDRLILAGVLAALPFQAYMGVLSDAVIGGLAGLVLSGSFFLGGILYMKIRFSGEKALEYGRRRLLRLPKQHHSLKLRNRSVLRLSEGLHAKKAFGGGDITLSIFMGFVLGWQGLLLAYAGGIALSLLFGIARAVQTLSWRPFREPYPLVPSFSVASLLVALTF